MTIITRFAPSPTGYLHIGSARTALFNWLYARKMGGKFLLRIEDTDRVRSTQDAINMIIKGMKWLGLEWDDDVIFQFARANRHQEVALQLLEMGKAYYCYCSPQELETMREKAKQEGRPPRYDGTWRDRDPSEAPHGVKPVVRLKVPQIGETTVEDLVQGQVIVQNQQLDDMILLRADQTPTYMLSVVVDDHDMGISHIIRGDDHLTNAFRQKQIYEAMGWEIPRFSHIPLIHGADGAKLSKRHGALGVEAYEEMGILPEALCNYLLRLGWSHGDDEIIPREKAIEWFNIESIGKSPARFDMAKLTNLNAHYVRQTENNKLLSLIQPLVEKQLDRSLDINEKNRIIKGMEGLKQRAKTTLELADSALIYASRSPLPLDDKAKDILTSEAKNYLLKIIPVVESLQKWEESSMEAELRAYADQHAIKFGLIAQPLRAALTGKGVSPGIFDVMMVLGKEESLKRLYEVTQ
jgi:glutamyl-tRNA synthetase